MKHTKKALTYVLVFAMVLSLMSFSALAGPPQHTYASPWGPTETFDNECGAENALATMLGISSGSSSSGYLTADITLTSDIKINGNIKLDLNGYRLILGNYKITVNSGATLSIYDSNGAGKSYKYTCTYPIEELIAAPSSATAWTAAGEWDGSQQSKTVKKVDGGCITGGTAGALSVKGTLNLFGGNIVGNKGGSAVFLQNSGKFNMYAGNIIGNSDSSSSAAVTVTGGEFSMYGGNISNNCTGTLSYAIEGTILLNSSSGKINIIDGTIFDNYVSGGGGAIAVKEGALNIKGGLIKGNKAGNLNDHSAGEGSAVYLYSNSGTKTLTMTGGMITGNAAGKGAAIAVNAGTANLYGGMISNNTGNANGGVTVASGKTLNLGGTVVISGNTTDAAIPVPSDVKLDSNANIYVINTGTDYLPKAGMSVGLCGSGGKVSNASSGVEQFFFSNDPAKYVKFNSGNSTLNLEAIPSATPKNHAITVAPAVGGSVFLGKQYAHQGETVTLGTIPAEGYTYKSGSLKVYDTMTKKWYTDIIASKFTMPDADVTVYAEFEPLHKIINFRPNSLDTTNHGSLTINKTYGAYNDYVTVNVVPQSNNYRLVPGSLKVNGSANTVSPTANDNEYTFFMPSADAAVTCEFEQIFSITNSKPDTNSTVNGGHLSIYLVAAEVTAAAANDTVYIVAIPETGYRLKKDSITVNSGNVTVSSTGGFSFTMPAEAVTVDATFEKLFTITDSTDATGSLTFKVGDDTVTAAAIGEEVNVVATGSTGYRCKEGTIKATYKGGTEIVVTGGKFTMPDDVTEAGVTVTAEFEAVKTITNQRKEADKNTNHGWLEVAKNGKADEFITIKVHPETNYRLKEGTLKASYVDGDTKYRTISEDEEDGVYFFRMPNADVTVTADFERYYNITNNRPESGKSGAHGYIEVVAQAAEGEKVTITAVPDENYRIKKDYKPTAVYEHSGTQSLTVTPGDDENTFTFTMPAYDVTVDVQAFERYYTIENLAPHYAAQEATNHGFIQINPESETAAEGEDIELIVEPLTGYRFKNVIITDEAGAEYNVNGKVEQKEGLIYVTFKMPAKNLKVSATFEKSGSTPYTPGGSDIDIDIGGGGSSSDGLFGNIFDLIFFKKATEGIKTASIFTIIIEFIESIFSGIFG